MKIASAVTSLILETFRLNGALLSAGDRLIGDLGLSSARWQVLGPIADAPQALTVAQIARNMGLTRQAVQRVVNEMVADGLLQLASNPRHRRARLVAMTDEGRRVYEAAMARQAPWASALGGGLTEAEINDACRVLLALRLRLRPDDDLAEGEIHGVEEHE